MLQVMAENDYPDQAYIHYFRDIQFQPLFFFCSDPFIYYPATYSPKDYGSGKVAAPYGATAGFSK